ncbi:MAG: glycosyltransferase [Ginsengibacter sp.]
MPKNDNPRVLVAPLDWGLGHATRCIPIINQLILLGCTVYIVADKKNFSLLKKEFPQTVFLRYKGYEIAYSRQKKFLFLKLIFQLPKVILRVLLEKKWLKNIVKKYSIDAVISDNRFGMHNKNIPSIYITHQLSVKTGNRFFDTIAQKIHYYFIRRFTTCWVPDFEKNGLAGELSHPKNLPANSIYIGPLSRFTQVPDAEILNDLLIIISGPEPQRTIFEKEILEQIKGFKQKIIFIRGLPSEDQKPGNFDGVKIENHVPGEELNKLMAESKIIISRSGYTTVMDLATSNKKAILIPTPGQTEQEYLAEYLIEKKYFLTENQEDFSIQDLLEKAKTFHFQEINFAKDGYKKIIMELVKSIKSDKF